MELLVVIVIIVLLAALLIPAVAMAREAARRNQCLTNQRSLATAIITYSNANGGLPGYLNQQGDIRRVPSHSWAVAIFPNIGENRRYEVLMSTPQGTAVDLRVTAPLPALICPSDNPREDARLNYVVNCGPAETPGINGNNALHFTLFRDRRPDPDEPRFLTAVNTRVKIEDIPNGASNTILLSENVNAGIWHHANWNTFAPRNELPHNFTPPPQLPPPGRNTRSSVAVENLGFVWARLPAFLPNSSANEPRPSSKHPGTVIVAFADGSARAINDDISIDEWLQIVCPDYEGWRELFP